MKALDALKLLQEGKRIRRNFWSKSTYIELKGSLIYDDKGLTDHLIVVDTLSDDWEIYEEPKPKKQVWQWRYRYKDKKEWQVSAYLLTEKEAKISFNRILEFKKHAGPFEVEE